MANSAHDSKQYNYSQQVCHKTCIRSLESLGWAITHNMNYTLTAQVSMNISSWGETVSITISDNGVISAISQCKGQLFDWGKNKKNISTLFKKVDELIEKVSNEDVENLDSSNDILGQIERLATLQEKGIISKDEFEEKKKDLLKRM